MISTEDALKIKVETDVVLGYRFWLLMHLVEELELSEELLFSDPPYTGIVSWQHKCGNYTVRYYARWADYDRKVKASMEYKAGELASDAWLKANKHIFNHLSKLLRIYNQEMWLSMTNAISWSADDWFLGLANSWNSIAIGQSMGMAGRKNHQDWEDKNRVFNTVVSFGV